MASLLPINFNIPSEGAIASYNYYDISEGSGIVVFYGAQTSDAYILTTNSSLSSKNTYTSGGTALFDQNFEVSFNTPKTIKGVLTSNIPVYASGGLNNYFTTQIKVYKWDGSSATLLSDDTDTTPSTSSDLGADKQYMCIRSEVPKTDFKKGETLRIQVIVTNSNGASGRYVGHDPTNRSTSVGLSYTRMSFLVPFAIQL